ELLKAGASVTEVARRLGCSHSSVILWREAVRRRGLKALTAKPALDGRAAAAAPPPSAAGCHELEFRHRPLDHRTHCHRRPPHLRRALAPRSCGPAAHHARLVVPETRAARRRAR